MFSKSGPATMFSDTLAVSYAAQMVIAMRLTKMSLGIIDTRHEGVLMVAEKIDAAAEATWAVTQSLMTGQPGLAPARAMAVYKKRVRQNLDRLSQT